MKLTPYKDALKMGKEAFDKVLVGPKSNRAKKKAELKMAELEEVIATKNAELQEMCGKEDIDFDQIIDLQDGIALEERRMKQYQKILDEMFPED